MFEAAIHAATKCRCRHHSRLASALAALVVAATAGVWAGQPGPRDAPGFDQDVSVFGGRGVERAFAADGRPEYARQIPPILRPDHTGNVGFEIVYAGSVEALRVFRLGAAGWLHDEFPRAETGAIGGRPVSIFRPSWPMGEFLLRFGLTIDVDRTGGPGIYLAPATVPLGANGFPTINDLLSVRAMSTTVRDVPVVQIDARAQYSSHVVNLVAPSLTSSPYLVAADFAKQFYSYFGDDYEQLSFVFSAFAFVGAGHGHAQNQISGINLRVFDYSREYGSAGRLEGFDFSDGMDNVVSNHELSHQWGHYFDWQAIAGIPGWGIHTPLWGHYESPLTVDALIKSNQRLRPLGGGEWEVEQPPAPTRLPPLQLYAMGLLEASAVPPVDIFENQSRPRVQFGERVSGATRRVTIDQIVAKHGPRVGPVVSSVRRATVLLSRETLATPEEMTFWTLMAQRLEDPDETGMIDQLGIGSFRAVSGVPLHTRIIPPPGGPILAGHTTLEPDVLDPRDFAGVVLDTPPRLEVPQNGLLRMEGRIVDPQIAGATRIYTNFGSGRTIYSDVGPDGRFSIIGSPEMPVGRFQQRLIVTIGGVDRTIARVNNVRLFGGVRIPPPPVALTASASGRSVTIRWSPDTGSPPANYFLDVGSSPGASNVGSFPTTATTLSASGVPDGRYYLRVRAANQAGVSAPSAQAVFTVGCAPPEPPAMLTGAVNGTSVTLAWQPSPTGGVTYTIVAGSTSGASNIAQVGVGTNTSLTAAVPVGRYFVRVRAVGPCGGSESNEIELLVGLPPRPGAPQTLTSQVTGGTVSLAWQAAAGVVGGYVIEAGSQPGLSNLAAVTIGNVLAFSTAGVAPGTYHVRVRAFNASGQGPPSNEVAVVVR